MKRDERRTHGVHYTTEPLVLRVLCPLFLDDLETRLLEASTPEALHAFLEHLGSLTFFDPACGTGNFLVVAYRALHDLECRVLKKLRHLAPQRADFEETPFRLDLQQFHGIELDPKAATIARENLERTALEAGRPSSPGPRIVVGNALRMDWNEVLPAERASFVFGNPPFVGMAWMTPEQQEDRRRAFDFADVRGLRVGRLDYAASFFAKSITYGMGSATRFAYVVTNSICQGEHPRSLGPLFEKHGYHIDFAYRTFPWTTGETAKAKVHVVIVGFSRIEGIPKHFFDFDSHTNELVATPAKNINFYLTNGPNIFPAKRAQPWSAIHPLATKGSQPTDGGHLIVEAEDLADVLADPIASKYVRRYVQATEFLWNKPRHCLWLVAANPEELETSPILRSRLAHVKALREASRTPRVRACASTPALFTQIRQPKERYLALPEVSSAKRKWIPAAFLEPEVIAGNKLIILPGADPLTFGFLQSSMFMVWVRAMAGRLKSDISISPDLTYCTFPFPEADETMRERVKNAAVEILRVRTKFVGKSLGDLYEPNDMPRELVVAHEALDAEVDALFGGDVREENRFEILLSRYLSSIRTAAFESPPHDDAPAEIT